MRRRWDGKIYTSSGQEARGQRGGRGEGCSRKCTGAANKTPNLAREMSTLEREGGLDNRVAYTRLAYARGALAAEGWGGFLRLGTGEKKEDGTLQRGDDSGGE